MHISARFKERQDNLCVMNDFELLKRKIVLKGLNCENYKENYLKRRINIRMRVNNVSSYDQYINVLCKKGDEYKALVETIAVNVTEFFRNPETFRAVEKIVPNLKNKVRVWSAACSTGEEPYSIAFMLKEHNKDFSILATDIDDDALSRAKKGVYSPDKIGGMDKKYLKHFCFKDGRYEVLEDIKKNIRFEKHDLISGEKQRNFDMIFCRNVCIYFTKEMQEKLYMDFYNALNRGGYMVLGRIEYLSREAQEKFIAIDNIERIYQKI